MSPEAAGARPETFEEIPVPRRFGVVGQFEVVVLVVFGGAVRAHARLLVNRARVYAATAKRLPATPRASWSARGVPSAPDRPNRRDRRRGNLRSLGAVLWRSNMPNEFVGKPLQRLALAAFAQ